MREVHHSSNTFLIYFHYCNKGHHPLSVDWSSDSNIALAELDPEQIEFLNQTRKFVDEKSKLAALSCYRNDLLTHQTEQTFHEVRDQRNFEHDYFFISQLYDTAWSPRDTI